MTSPLARPSLTILLHDDGGDDVFERLVQPRQLLDACLQAAGGPLAHLRGWGVQDGDGRAPCLDLDARPQAGSYMSVAALEMWMGCMRISVQLGAQAVLGTCGTWGYEAQAAGMSAWSCRAHGAALP